MMREIKFRAWDKKRKETFPVHELVINKFNGEPNTIKGYTDDEKDVWNVHGGHFMKYANENRYVLMQYTGLNDKNGKEIYEGDIIRIFNNELDEEESWVDEVIYHMGGFFSGDEDLLGNVHFRAKVIGNIYENHELLGGEV